MTTNFARHVAIYSLESVGLVETLSVSPMLSILFVSVLLFSSGQCFNDFRLLYSHVQYCRANCTLKDAKAPQLRDKQKTTYK